MRLTTHCVCCHRTVVTVPGLGGGAQEAMSRDADRDDSEQTNLGRGFYGFEPSARDKQRKRALKVRVSCGPVVVGRVASMHAALDDAHSRCCNSCARSRETSLCDSRWRQSNAGLRA